MSKKTIVRLAFYSSIILGLALLYRFDRAAVEKEIQSEIKNNETPFPVSRYKLEDVAVGINLYPPLVEKIERRVVVGGVVAHHLLVQNTIAEYFQYLSSFAYKRVILLGPNHGELGEKMVVTSTRPWDTPYGTVYSDQAVITGLSNCATNDPYPLENDHSLEVIMPFIKMYLPEAQVVPLMLSGRLKMDDIDALVSCLIPHLGQETLVLVSSDFSHYLKSSVAKQRDAETYALLKSWDVDRLITLNSDHLDSPPALVTLMELMQAVGTKDMEVFAHTDASIVSNNPFAATTTHYFLNFYVKR